MPLIEPYEIDKISMFAGRSIDPVPDPAALGLKKADEKAASGRSGDIADHPVAAFAPACGQIVTANGLHVLCKPF